MSKQAHTPGPWEADYIEDQGWTVLSASDDVIAILGDDDMEGDASLEADANLIAAAPKLLAEAKWALDVLTNQFGMDPCEGLDALREAITEATGGAS